MCGSHETRVWLWLFLDILTDSKFYLVRYQKIKKKKEEYNRRDWVYNMRRICFFVKFNCHTSSKRGASVRHVVVVVAFNLKSLYLENSHRINIIKTYENSRITVIYNVLILRKFMRITLFKNWPIRGDPLCWSNFSV